MPIKGGRLLCRGVDDQNESQVDNDEKMNWILRYRAFFSATGTFLNQRTNSKQVRWLIRWITICHFTDAEFAHTYPRGILFGDAWYEPRDGSWSSWARGWKRWHQVIYNARQEVGYTGAGTVRIPLASPWGRWNRQENQTTSFTYPKFFNYSGNSLHIKPQLIRWCVKWYIYIPANGTYCTGHKYCSIKYTHLVSLNYFA